MNTQQGVAVRPFIMAWMTIGLGLLGGPSGTLQADEASPPPAPQAAQEAASPPAEGAQPDAPPLVVENNMDVGLEYTLTVDGSVVDTTDGKPPLHYVHGRNQLVPGLERELAGMRVGESKQVTVTPDDGYGQVDPNAFIELPKEQLPAETPPTVGMVLRGVNPDGRSFQATIAELKDATVVLDLNHPFAGKVLTFTVKVVGIAPAPAPAAGGA